MNEPKLPFQRLDQIGPHALYYLNLVDTIYAVVSNGEWDKATMFFDIERAHALVAMRINTYLASLAEDGKVAWVESGRDCDCVEYDGVVHITDATVAAYEALSDRINDYADGPFRLRLCRVSETRQIRRESRDLVMEAYEDGHPHAVYSRFA